MRQPCTGHTQTLQGFRDVILHKTLLLVSHLSSLEGAQLMPRYVCPERAIKSKSKGSMKPTCVETFVTHTLPWSVHSGRLAVPAANLFACRSRCTDHQ
jgi:hypothetical protein